MGDRGNVFAASKGSIGIRFRYRGVSCEERIKLEPTPRNIAYARNLRGKILADIARGSFDYHTYFPGSKRSLLLARDPGALATVGKKLEEWLASVEKSVERSTYIGYERAVLRTLNAAFGTIVLRDLSRGQIRTWIAEQTTTAKRINNVLTPLRCMLAECVADSILRENPIAGVIVKRKSKREDDDIDPFTPDERELILSNCAGQVRNLFQFAFWTGMRTSEMIALRWQDVDFANGLVLVRQALVQGELKGPKTKAGRRAIKMLPAAREALLAQRAHTLLQGGMVFHDPRTDKPWAKDKPIREWNWRPTLKRAGVRYRYPYQTRHTYASTLLSAGENPVWVASQMGHKDWVMIVRTYGRWIPEVDPTAGDKAAAICGAGVGDSSAKPRSA